MFYDLCLGQEAENQFVVKDKLAMAILLGYDCTAVNRNSDYGFLNRGSMEGSKVAPELMQSLGPAVQSALLSHQGLVRPTGLPPRQMAQLSRVTFEGDHGMAAAAAALQLPGSRLRQTFDIVAIKPNSAPALVKACQVLDVDIVTLDLSVQLNVRNGVASLAAAVRRGIHFELLYRPAVVSDDRSRTLFFARAKRLCQALRGRNIIISSGAEAAFDLRGPYDIINIASLLGLNPADAKAAISSRCEAVLRHAAEAKRGGVRVTLTATALPRQIAAPAVAAAAAAPPPPPLLPPPPLSELSHIVEAWAAQAQAEAQWPAELHLAAPERGVPSGEPRPATQTLPALTKQRLPLEAGQLAEAPAPETSQWQRQAPAWEGQQPQAAWEGQQQLAAEVPAANIAQRVTRGSRARQLQAQHEAQLQPPGSTTQQLQENAAGNASGSAQLAKWARRAARKREWNLPLPSKKQRAAGVGEPMKVASQPAAVGGGDQAPGDMGNAPAAAGVGEPMEVASQPAAVGSDQAPGDMGNAPAAAQGSEPEQVQGNGASGGGAEGNLDPALAQPSKKKGKKGKGAGLGALTAMFKPQQRRKKKKKRQQKKPKKKSK